MNVKLVITIVHISVKNTPGSYTCSCREGYIIIDYGTCVGKIEILPLSGFITISPYHLYITFPWIDIQIFGFI